MQITEPSVATSILTGAIMLTLVVGYARSVTRSHGPVFHLVVSIILVFFAYVARTAYWSSYWLAFPPVVEVGVDPNLLHNVLFDLVAVWGGVHGHIAIYQMIPKGERAHWRIYTAWLYPPFAAFRCVRRAISWAMRWRS